MKIVSTRIKEHQKAVKILDTQKSAVAEHVAMSSGRPCWEGTTILTQEPHWFKRRMKEALLIKRNDCINQNHGSEENTAKRIKKE